MRAAPGRAASAIFASQPRRVVCRVTASKQSARPEVQPVCAGKVSRRAVLQWLAAGIPLASVPAPAQAGELLELIEPFAVFDRNSDGVMDVQELQAAFQQVLGKDVPRAAVRRQLVPALDFNEDGQVATREEFLRALSLQLPVDSSWWRQVDTDGSGSVELRELRAAVGDVGGEAGDLLLRAAFRHSDLTPRDGRLSPAEAARAMQLIAGGVVDAFRTTRAF